MEPEESRRRAGMDLVRDDILNVSKSDIMLCRELPDAPAHIFVRPGPDASGEATLKRKAPAAAPRGMQSFLTWDLHASALNGSSRPLLRIRQ